MRNIIIVLLCLIGPSLLAQTDNELTQMAIAYEAIAETSAEADFPIIIKESSHNFERTLENLRRSITGSNFRLIREQALIDGFDLEEQQGQREAIVYFCNFAMVSKAILIDNRVGQFLPCRVTVVERQDKVYVMSINPKRFSRVFPDKKLTPICNQISDMYKSVINEATF